MPQLEQIGTYLSQIVWLFITFGVLYVVLWKLALPRIAEVLQERQGRIDGDLERAEKLKTEAEAVLAAYQATLTKAQADAQAVSRERADAFAVEAASRHEELSAQLAEGLAAAEQRIAAARKEALANVRALAGEIVRAAADRLVSIEIGSEDAEAAVDQVMRERHQ
jgi:F-type H+-transporting ATPase subunit b